MGGPTRLTEAGQALLPFCASILAVAGEAVRALADLRAAHTGRVALAASQTVGTYVVPRLLAAFRARNPGVRLIPAVSSAASPRIRVNATSPPFLCKFGCLHDIDSTTHFVFLSMLPLHSVCFPWRGRLSEPSRGTASDHHGPYCRAENGCLIAAQVTVTLQVEQSRRACDAVARGEADCAIIGGDIPEDLESILQVPSSQNFESFCDGLDDLLLSS